MIDLFMIMALLNRVEKLEEFRFGSFSNFSREKSVLVTKDEHHENLAYCCKRPNIVSSKTDISLISRSVCVYRDEYLIRVVFELNSSFI